MITLAKIFTCEYDVDLAEFLHEEDGFVSYAYIEWELLLDDEARGHYGSFYNVGAQLKKGPEDVEDALNRWREKSGKF